MIGSNRLQNRYNMKAAIALWLHQKIPADLALVEREGDRKATSSEQDEENDSFERDDVKEPRSVDKSTSASKKGKRGTHLAPKKKISKASQRQGGTAGGAKILAQSDSNMLRQVLDMVSDLQDNQTRITNSIESIIRNFDSHLIRHDKSLEGLIASDQKLSTKIGSLEGCVKQLASNMGRGDLVGSGVLTRSGTGIVEEGASTLGQGGEAKRKRGSDGGDDGSAKKRGRGRGRGRVKGGQGGQGRSNSGQGKTQELSPNASKESPDSQEGEGAHDVVKKISTNGSEEEAPGQSGKGESRAQPQSGGDDRGSKHRPGERSQLSSRSRSRERSPPRSPRRHREKKQRSTSRHNSPHREVRDKSDKGRSRSRSGTRRRGRSSGRQTPRSRSPRDRSREDGRRGLRQKSRSNSPRNRSREGRARSRSQGPSHIRERGGDAQYQFRDNYARGGGVPEYFHMPYTPFGMPSLRYDDRMPGHFGHVSAPFPMADGDRYYIGPGHDGRFGTSGLTPNPFSGGGTDYDMGGSSRGGRTTLQPVHFQSLSGEGGGLESHSRSKERDGVKEKGKGSREDERARK